MSQQTSQRLPLFLILILLIAIGSYAVVGASSRMLADDYCTANEGLRYGAVGAVTYNYQNWAGLYVNAFAKGLFAPVQPQIHSVQTVILILGLALGLGLIVSQTLSLLQLSDPKWFNYVLTLFLLLMALYGAPNLRNVYWWSVIVPYGLPVALGLMGVALMIWYVRQPRSLVSSLLVGLTLCVLAIVIVGSANTFVLFILSALPIAIGYCWWRLAHSQRRSVFAILSVVWIVSLIAFLVVFTAPGNAVRQAQVFAEGGFATPSTSELIETSFAVLLAYFNQPPTIAYTLFTFVAVMTLLIMSQQQDVQKLAALPLSRHPLLDSMVILLVMVLAIGFTVVTSVYGVGLVGPHTMFLPRVVQFLGAAALAYMAVVALARRGFPARYLRTRPVYRLVSSVLVLLVFVFPLGALAYNIALLPNIQQYAADWDARHEFLREQAAGNNIVSVAPYRFSLAKYLNLEDVEDETRFVQACASTYYGVQKIEVIATP